MTPASRTTKKPELGTDIFGCADCSVLVITSNGKEPNSLKKHGDEWLCRPCERKRKEAGILHA